MNPSGSMKDRIAKEIKRKNEKSFREHVSVCVVMKAFIDWHKKYIEW